MSAQHLSSTQLPAPLVQPGSPVDPATALPGTPPAGQPGDPLGTVGIALLAYGLVQLLSRVVDRLPFGRPGAAEAGDVGFTRDDRKRIERLVEIAAADHARIERMQEELKEVYDYTRWATEQRRRHGATAEDGSWRHRVEGLLDQTNTNQRLVGQALDELREVQGKLDNILRKLRALWIRVGQRRNDRK
ncbi:MAG TPA: hypothetical protein VFQ76_09825 [Longimicrobiaceae bacterium]|nr:hypothetical protein [Longimicrobiaceae bacterium]